MKKIKYSFIAILALLFSACLGVPEDVKVVDNIDANQYLGTWYEIARLDHSFERGLVNVSATYSMRDDGGIKVINRGYNPETKNGKITDCP